MPARIEGMHRGMPLPMLDYAKSLKSPWRRRVNLKERDRFGKIGLAEGGDRWERVWSNLPLIPMLMGYPPIRSPENVSKIMGALHPNLDRGEQALPR